MSEPDTIPILNPWQALSHLISVVIFEAQRGYKSVDPSTGEVTVKIRDYETCTGFGQAQHDYVFNKVRAEKRRLLSTLQHIRFLDSKNGFNQRHIVLSTRAPNVSCVPTTWIAEYECELLASPFSASLVPIVTSVSPSTVATANATSIATSPLPAVHASTSTTAAPPHLNVAHSLSTLLPVIGTVPASTTSAATSTSVSPLSATSAIANSIATPQYVASLQPTLSERITRLSLVSPAQSTIIPKSAADNMQKYFKDTIRPLLDSVFALVVTQGENNSKYRAEFVSVLREKMLSYIGSGLGSANGTSSGDTSTAATDCAIVDSIVQFLTYFRTKGSRTAIEEVGIRTVLASMVWKAAEPLLRATYIASSGILCHNHYRAM